MKTEFMLSIERVLSFEVDDFSSKFRFIDRLARENGWTIEYAKKVFVEYKRFMWLCKVSNMSMTPSDEVDQVWHLHMTYMKSYQDFCENYLGKVIYHNPSKGGKSEQEKFANYYVDTLEHYHKTFGEVPPSDIWPPLNDRFGNNFRRVDLNENWVIKKPSEDKSNVVILTSLIFSFIGYIVSIFLSSLIIMILMTITFILTFYLLISISEDSSKRHGIQVIGCDGGGGCCGGGGGDGGGDGGGCGGCGD